jgi:hypothetical protein
VAVLLAALGLLTALGACTPGTDITAAESDVIVTNYDQEFDFASLKTFAMRDTVAHLTEDGTDDPNLSRDNDSLVVALVKENFEAVGYEWVDADSSSTAPEPDFAVLIAATSTDFVNTNWGCGGYWGGYPPGWGWGWPGYGCGGPPTTSVAFSTGTLIVAMIDPDLVDDGAEDIPLPWDSEMNGVLNDTSASVRQRLTSGINQMFKQSPYLGTSQ